MNKWLFFISLVICTHSAHAGPVSNVEITVYVVAKVGESVKIKTGGRVYDIPAQLFGDQKIHLRKTMLLSLPPSEFSKFQKLIAAAK